jgi:AcrR family transcriptional regulator
MPIPADPSVPCSDTATRQRRREARPQELLDAALELFARKGYAATRAEEVAARAGVSKGTLYLYFQSKAELLKAVIRDRLSSQIRLSMLEADEHASSASELLRRVVAPWWLRVVEGPASGVFKLVVTEARSFPEIAECYRLEVVEPGRQLIGGILRRGIADGEFRAGIDVDAAVHSLMLPMVMLCVHRHSLGACAPDEALDARAFVGQHVELLVRGLRADAAPGEAHA